MLRRTLLAAAAALLGPLRVWGAAETDRNVSAGGFNCRHMWVPRSTVWDRPCQERRVI